MEEELLLKVEEYKKKMQMLELQNNQLETRLRTQSRVLEKKEQIFEKEMCSIMKQFESLEKEKEESQEMANLFESNLKELENKIDQKNEEFDDVLVQLLQKEKEIRHMEDKINDRKDLEEKVQDLEDINDMMLKDKIQLKQKLEEIGSTIRKFERKKDKVERISVQCLTPRRSKRMTTFKLQNQQEEIKKERELRTRILQMLNPGDEDQSQNSLIWRKSEFDQNDSQLSKANTLKSYEADTPFKITFKQLERLEDQKNNGCLTERSSNRKSKMSTNLINKNGKENGMWTKMQSTPFDSNLKSVKKKPQLLLSSDIFEEEEFDVSSELKSYFQVRKSIKSRTPQHHSRKSSLFNKNKFLRYTSMAKEEKDMAPEKSQNVMACEQSLDSSSIQEYMSGSNMHFPMMQIPSLISPRRIPMKYSKTKGNSTINRPQINNSERPSEKKVPALDLSGVSKYEQIVPKKSVLQQETLDYDEMDTDKSEWMSRLNASEIMIVGHPQTENSFSNQHQGITL